MGKQRRSTEINRQQMLMNHIDEYGIKVVDIEKQKGFSMEKYHFEVINMLLFNSISQNKPSKLKFFLSDHPLLVLMADKIELF